MSDSALTVDEGNYLRLAQNASFELERFLNSPGIITAMMVPNQTRRVFGDNGASVSAMKALQEVLILLLATIHLEKSGRVQNRAPSVSKPWYEVRPRSIAENSF